jgi:cbb3-type cytochrome oxidase subunit 3
MQHDYQEIGVNHFRDKMWGTVYTAATVVSMPVEVIIRPFFGTRFFQPYNAGLSLALLLLLSLLAKPFIPPIMLAAHIQPPPSGLYNILSLAQLFFFGMIFHTFRSFRRMRNLSLELNSTYEGPALPFFALLPGGKSFWMVRLVLEPIAVIVIAYTLNHLGIFDNQLEGYLIFAAICMATKSYLHWFKAWETIRKILDAKYLAPVLSGMINGTAEDNALDQFHYASFPKHLPPDVHRAAIQQLATM